MLIQLIYRSRATRHFSADDLRRLSEDLTVRNKRAEIGGVLLYDGTYFLQVLEGQEQVVDPLFAHLRKDPRHSDIVLLLRDPIYRTRFHDFRMGALDVRQAKGMPTTEILAQWGALLGRIWQRDHRCERIMEAFVRGRWQDPTPSVAWFSEAESQDAEQAHTDKSLQVQVGPCQVHFALQPIVHTRAQRITSVEALLRGPAGESPQAVLAALPANRLHEFDLKSKGDAIALAAALQLDCMLSVNLLPMSLLSNDNAVEFLVEQCRTHGWNHEQLLVEITEEEAITHLDTFLNAVHKLRASGIQVAIDDFGAGHAGLSLLADFQPDKLKLDKRLVQGVAASGPRQAIVRSVVEFCFCLGITVIAEGVESVADWRWLQSAGIRRFQGFLFARPHLQGLPPVAWPPH